MGLVQTTYHFSILVDDTSYGYNGQVMTVAEIKSQWLWGIPLCNPVTGETISDSTIEERLRAMQKRVEGIIDAKLFKQYVEEQKNFIRDEYMNWGYVKASYLVNKPYYIIGRLNQQPVLKFPNEWVVVRRKVIKDDDFSRNMYFVPNGQGTAVSFSLNYTINNLYNFYGSRVIPEYWFLQYLTGFEIIPADIINVIGKMTALELLPLIELIVTSNGGFAFGAASTSLSMDGLSQSNSKVSGGNIFKQRIEQYTKEVNQQLGQLKNIYSEILFDVA